MKLRYEYHQNGQVAKIIYPDSNEVTYELDMAGRLDEVKYTWECDAGVSAETMIDNIEYEAWGPATAWDFDNDFKSRRVYDNMGRLTETRNFNDSISDYCRQFTYSNGFLFSETQLDTAGDTTNFGTFRYYAYDGLGRLVTSSIGDPNDTTAPVENLSYTFDKNNNLNTKYMSSLGTISYGRFDGSNCDSLIVFSNDSSWFFTRDDRGRTIVKTSYPTDAITDTSLWRTRSFYEYDARNLLTQYRDTVRVLDTTISTTFYEHLVDFTYNALGQRVAALLTTTEHHHIKLSYWQHSTTYTNKYYLWSGGKVIWEQIGSDEPRNHIYALGERLASAWEEEEELVELMMMPGEAE